MRMGVGRKMRLFFKGRNLRGLFQLATAYAKLVLGTRFQWYSEGETFIAILPSGAKMIIKPARGQGVYYTAEVTPKDEKDHELIKALLRQGWVVAEEDTAPALTFSVLKARENRLRKRRELPSQVQTIADIL